MPCSLSCTACTWPSRHPHSSPCCKSKRRSIPAGTRRCKTCTDCWPARCTRHMRHCTEHMLYTTCSLGRRKFPRGTGSMRTWSCTAHSWAAWCPRRCRSDTGRRRTTQDMWSRRGWRTMCMGQSRTARRCCMSDRPNTNSRCWRNTNLSDSTRCCRCSCTARMWATWSLCRCRRDGSQRCSWKRRTSRVQIRRKQSTFQPGSWCIGSWMCQRTCR